MSHDNGTPVADHAGSPPVLRLHAETAPDPARHSCDFRGVLWYGTYYTFTASQARVVAELWAAWKNGTPDVGHDTLLEAAGSEGNRLAHVFRNHPAWGTLVVAGPVRGAYRLAEPAGGVS